MSDLKPASNKLRAVLCDPEGVVCIDGSDGDRAEVQEALAIIDKLQAQAVEPVAEIYDGARGRVILESGAAALLPVGTKLYTAPQPSAPAVPDKRFPCDGAGDEDSYNAGWNACCEAVLQAASQPPSAQVDERAKILERELKDLIRAYVNMLEIARDRIIACGGQCDPVDMMERDDPALRKARASIATQQPEPWRVPDDVLRDAAKYRELNTPEIHDFLVAVEREALHQRDRWGSEHDAGKSDPDWFWLIGYLAGKVLLKPEKALHHIITTAAACLNWHARKVGASTLMRPGIGLNVQLPQSPAPQAQDTEVKP